MITVQEFFKRGNKQNFKVKYIQIIGDRIQPYLPLKSQGTARYQGLLCQNTGIIQQISGTGRDQELQKIFTQLDYMMYMLQVKIKFRLKNVQPRLILYFLCL